MARHTEKPWEPGHGNPYGLPSRGNGDEAWRLLMAPCDCGGTGKRLEIEGKYAIIRCIGDSDEDRILHR